jgi:hypothetical protein
MVLRSGGRIKEDDAAVLLTHHFNSWNKSKLINFNKEETGKEVKKKSKKKILGLISCHPEIRISG